MEVAVSLRDVSRERKQDVCRLGDRRPRRHLGQLGRGRVSGFVPIAASETGYGFWHGRVARRGLLRDALQCPLKPLREFRLLGGWRLGGELRKLFDQRSTELVAE